MATVRIPPVLRRHTGERTQVPASGDSLGAALESLFAKYPELRDSMLDDDGSIRRFVNVYVDDEDVRARQGLDTPVSDDSSIIILPAMAGGGA